MTKASGLTEPLGDPGPLLAWFADAQRDLPWRRTRDPWAILVSELMLQQTQVARVVDRWVRFLDRFPTVTTCADAARSAVIEEWQGLGYNRRAVSLHRTAIVVRDEHGGILPRTLSELRSLPGIGPYTSRAVLAFAHEEEVGVVDTNIGRVLARTHGRSLGPAEAQRLADGHVPSGLGWEWNQALMEVGARICRPAPKCGGCPVAPSCGWSSAGRPEPDPAAGSAAVSVPQSTFEGSDRQGRGRLVDALRSAPVSDDEVASIMGWPDDPARAERVASSLEADGLAVRVGSGYQLPS